MIGFMNIYLYACILIGVLFTVLKMRDHISAVLHDEVEINKLLNLTCIVMHSRYFNMCI